MIKLISENANKIKKIIKDYIGFYDEDIEQEVKIRAWKNKDKYQEQNKFSSWICTITANICKDYLKSKQFKQRIVTDGDEEVLQNIKTTNTPEKILTQKERQKMILKAVNSLPVKMKTVVTLYEFEDYSYEEIAKKLKIPTGTVKSRMNNARKILSDKLACLLEE